jgi:hypothetical protein
MSVKDLRVENRLEVVASKTLKFRPLTLLFFSLIRFVETSEDEEIYLSSPQEHIDYLR